MNKQSGIIVKDMKKQITINQKKLSNLIKKFENLSHNEDNYSVGGGLIGGMSRRNENAKYDSGKLTLDQASNVLAGAFGVEKSDVKAIIQSTYTLEWHHAGFLPKSYGGGMRKVYYMNATQINELLENFESIFANHFKEVEEKENAKAAAIAAELSREEKFFQKMEGLKKYLKFEKIERSRQMPDFVEKKEMKGKYGWFNADYKYSLDVYYSGIKLSNLKFWQRILGEDFQTLVKNISKFESLNYVSKSAERRENRANAAAQVAANELKKAEVAAVAAAKNEAEKIGCDLPRAANAA